MSDGPEDRPEERRRTGPLGDDGDAQDTRRVPPREEDAEATRQVPAGRRPLRETDRTGQGQTGETDDKETRVIRAPGYRDSGEAVSYPRGYFEAAEEREDRLRDMYGGVDWLASFLGFVFAAVVGAIFASVVGLVVAPLGFSLNLGGGDIGAAVITGLVLVGILIFLTYFFGGYVAGRLARFDGGRNGAMVLLWSFIAVALLALAGGVFSGFLPGAMAEGLRNFMQNNVLTTIGNLSQLGVVGIIIVVGALLIALLGGFLGGRLGSRYHTEIDRTT